MQLELRMAIKQQQMCILYVYNVSILLFFFKKRSEEMATFVKIGELKQGMKIEPKKRYVK